jgi:hypothetical protein
LISKLLFFVQAHPYVDVDLNSRINSVLRLESNFVGDIMIEVFLMLTNSGCSDGVEMRLYRPADDAELFTGVAKCDRRLRRQYYGKQTTPTIYELTFSSGERATCDTVEFVMRLYSLTTMEAMKGSGILPLPVYSSPLVVADSAIDRAVSLRQGFNNWYYFYTDIDKQTQGAGYIEYWPSSAVDQPENRQCLGVLCRPIPYMYMSCVFVFVGVA